MNVIDKYNGFLDRKILEAYHIIVNKPDLNGLYPTT